MRRKLGSILVLALALLACAPVGSQSAPSSAGQPSTAPAASRGPKVLRIALGRQIEAFVPVISGATTTTGGAGQVLPLVSNRLQDFDERGNKFAELAEALPTIRDGTWRVNADGSMETIWKLRSNLKWHDGAPVTAEDLMFGYAVVTTPGLPNTAGAYIRNIRDVTMLDPLTISVQWKEPFATADEPGENLPVLPKHLLENALASGRPEAFGNNSYFTTDFVGNGPFKLTEWTPGVQVDLAAFDDYYRGRPKLDRVIVRAIADFSTQIASVLAGEIDVTLPTGIDVESALSVQDQWQGSQNRVLLGSNGRMRMALPQSRAEAAQPRALVDPRVLQALFRAVDRRLISEAISRGLAPPGDGVVAPFYDIFNEIGSAMPAYPYDLAAAQRELRDLGWSRGSDGVLRNAQGEDFHTEISSGQSLRTDREMNTMAQGWKQLGMVVDFNPIPLAANTHELRWAYPGFDVGGTSLEEVLTLRRSCKNIPSAANQWRGTNRSGYCNQDYESLTDRLQVTIDPSARLQLMRDAVRFVMTDMSVFPMYWELNPILVVAGVKNVNPPTQPIQFDAFNAWEWDKD
jgi:peptide/nickel transport system substrate-binding protein